MKKLLLLFAAIVMASTGLWAETVTYIDADGQEQTADATEITNASSTLAEGWYVVKGSDVTTGSLTCSGAVHLILADGTKLTATGEDNQAGIQVSGDGNSLTIYGQTAQSGELIANGGYNAAGIGGGSEASGSNITINGGTVTANGDSAGIGGGAGGSGSNITINGGAVTAFSVLGAGIGGGENGEGSYITFTGGIVTASSECGAGIGGGYNGSGSYITIKDGAVFAIGSVDGAGIGGGCFKDGSNITITGGTVIANGGTGIGGGYQGRGYSITVATTLSVMAGNSENPTEVIENTGSDLASSLAGKRYAVIGLANTYIDAKGEEQQVAIEVKNSITPITWGAEGITTWYIVKGTDVRLSQGTICQGDVRLILADGGKLTATGEDNQAGIQVSGDGNSLTIYGQTAQSGELIANGGYNAAGIGGGYQGSGSNITINGGKVTANGGVNATAIGNGYSAHDAASNIIVTASHIVKAGDSANPTTVIAANRTYTTDLAGSLAGKRYVTIEPRIVSYIDENGEEKTASACEVKDSNSPVTWGEADRATWYVVTGTDVQLSEGAICSGDVRLILADGAKLTATGIYSSTPGIQVSGGENSLTIYGQTAQSGELLANGTDASAGIGGGNGKDGSNITINGGTVTAFSYFYGAGIGGGNGGSGFNITINGGTVTAKGGYEAAGIGGGKGGSSSNITINGGRITAFSDTGGGAGIGSGDQGACFDITITGGNVTASGDKYAPGIGGRYWNVPGPTITITGGTVTANGGQDAAGIGGSGATITVTGGTVIANGGQHAEGIGGHVTVATTLTVKADVNNPPTTVIENTGANLAPSLIDKRYVTVTDDVCNLTANQDPDHIKNYYSTFYSGKKAYEVPDDVTAYTGVTNGSVLTLTPVANGIIPAGEAVILRLTTTDNTAMTQQIQLTATTTTATKSTDNMLQGSDAAMTLPLNSYALSLGQKGVGFYKFDDVELPAHKAYLTYASGSAISLRFSFGDATDIDDVETEAPAKAYNLQGQQVDENYKGIVIVNGKKYVAK